MRRPVTQPKVSLTAPVRRMRPWVLSGPTWMMPSAVVQQRPTGKLRKRRPSGVGELDHVRVGHQQLDVFLAADRRHAAHLVGAAHRRSRPGPPGLSPTKGVAPAALRARSTARSVSGWVVTTFSGGAAAQQVDLDADALAGRDQRAPAPEGGAGALQGGRQLGVVLRLDVARRAPVAPAARSRWGAELCGIGRPAFCCAAIRGDGRRWRSDRQTACRPGWTRRRPGPWRRPRRAPARGVRTCSAGRSDRPLDRRPVDDRQGAARRQQPAQLGERRLLVVDLVPNVDGDDRVGAAVGQRHAVLGRVDELDSRASSRRRRRASPAIGGPARRAARRCGRPPRRGRAAARPRAAG